MFFPFVLLKPLTWLVFFERIHIGFHWLLSRFSAFSLGFWLFLIAFHTFKVTIRTIFCMLYIQMTGLKFGKAFPLLLWIDTILIFIDLRENNCRRWNIEIVAFGVSPVDFLIFRHIFMLILQLTYSVLLILWALMLMDTIMKLFIEGLVHAETELADWRFAFRLV